MMARSRLSFTSCALVGAMLGSAASGDLSQVWENRFNNSPSDYADYGIDVAVDSTGAVYTTGFTFFEVEQGQLFVPRFLTIKYAPNGTQEWVRDYSTAETWAAAAWIVEIDSDTDDVVVAGGVNGHEDWGLVKYDTAGVQEWAVTYEADSYYLTEPDDVYIDGEGNILLTGDIGTFDGADPQAPILMYSSTGQLVIDERYSGPAGLEAWGEAIASDAAGNIYVTGSTGVSGRSGDVFLVKYDSSGNFIWERTFGATSQVSYDGARDLIIDENGDIIVLGYLGYNTSAGVDVVLRKYNAAGDVVWSTTYGASGGLDEVVYAFQRDPQGNFIAAGYAETSPNQRDIFIVMFDSQGVFQWESTHNGFGNGDDRAYDVAVGPDGAILAAGVIQAFANVDFAFTAEFNPEDGGLLDIEEYGGPTDGDSWAEAVALGPNDEVYVTGATGSFNTDYDAVTLRYDRANDATSALLTDFIVAFGQHIAGTVAEIQTSDNFFIRTRSRPGFLATEANRIDMRIGARSDVLIAQEIRLTIEGRLNNPGGTVQLRLKNWTNNQFQQVHQYSMGTIEGTESIEGIAAANRIRQADGRIELSIKQFMVATFSPLGFDSFTDYVGVAVVE